MVKLLLTAATLLVMVLAGRRSYPVSVDARLLSFTAALLFSTLGFLSVGFLIASSVPTARFAQPVGSLILYPMLGLSGLFVPIEELPPMLQTVARALPVTYAVSLLRGIWHGEGWLAHAGDEGNGFKERSNEENGAQRSQIIQKHNLVFVRVRSLRCFV